MNKENLTKKELEQLCLKENIIIERHDPITDEPFFLPNLNKIGIMIREFDFLVEGASRGRAINEISKIELHLYKHDDNPDLQSNFLATNYSEVSMYIEEKKNLIADKKSDNWNLLFTRYFTLEDIYNYFHKTEGASSFFKKFKIYEEMIELNYHLKLMEYLKSQVQLVIPLDDDKEIPFRIDSLEFRLLILHKSGFLKVLKDKMKETYYVNGAKFLTTFLSKQTAMWKQISNLLRDLDQNEEDSIVNDPNLQALLKDLLYHYKLDLRE